MKTYPVIGKVKMKCGVEVPLLDIPMMADETDKEMITQNAIDNYKREFHVNKVDADTAKAWQRRYVDEITNRQIADN